MDMSLAELIKSEYPTVRKFAAEVGLTESMVSYILSGKRRLMEWHEDNFCRALKINKDELHDALGGK